MSRTSESLPPGTHGRFAPWAFLAPATLLLGLFVLYPTLRALFWSFTDADLFRPGDAAHAGLTQYSALLNDPRFRQAFLNTAAFALMVVPLQTLLAFFLALWVNRPEPWWQWLRTAFFLPVVVSLPVLAILWTMLYQPVRGNEMGLLNALITQMGIPAQRWLQDPALALPAIAAMSIWQGVGFQMLIFLSGLQNLDAQTLEAARIDGAGPMHRLTCVIIPAMRNTFIFVISATLILAFRLFAQPVLMTRGGPDGSTRSLIQFIYETTFQDRNLGLASAGLIIFLLLVTALTLIQRTLLREEKS